MKSLKPHEIQLNMAGQRPFYEAAVLEPVLAALQADPLFAVETWGLDEHSNFPYDLQRILLSAKGQISPYVLQLKRKQPVRHTTSVRLNRLPALIVHVNPATHESHWQSFFELCDDLASAYQPDIAWAHIFTAQEPPLEGEGEKLHYLMDAGVTGSGLEYESEGPGGLALRTYLGPSLVERFGRDRLLQTPAVVTELPWGGVRIDLLDRPWQADLPDLLEAWTAAMNHLRPAGIFSDFEVEEDGNVYFTRAANW